MPEAFALKYALGVILMLVALDCASSSNEKLRAELLAMAAADQAARSVEPDVDRALAEQTIDRLNRTHTECMKRIVAEHGWPGRSLVGVDGASAAWLLVQHADHAPAFQRRVLQLLEPLVSTGEVRASDYAYLWDRTHHPQRYGTQGECTEEGRWVPREIETPAEVDARRADAGLFPPRLEDYMQMGSAFCRDAAQGEHGQ